MFFFALSRELGNDLVSKRKYHRPRVVALRVLVTRGVFVWRGVQKQGRGAAWREIHWGGGLGVGPGLRLGLGLKTFC